MNDAATENGIAIVGMACRFPLANTAEEYWRKLREGEEAIRPTVGEDLIEAGVPADVVRSPKYVGAVSIIDGIEEFDARFFGLTRREAEVLDPQLRVLLECSYLALEQAGYADRAKPRDVGVFVGTGGANYANFNIATRPDIFEALGQMAVSIANDKDFAATQIAYRLNLRGPAISINTACSTSLVAVHQAVRALLNYECDAALAGGATVKPTQKEGYLFQEGGILSPDGHCRPFSDDAKGTVAGNGGGVVLLKRLEDALADGDDIDAVIVGSAVNNDGAAKVGITAPSVVGQARVIREAIGVAELAKDQVAYVETHGTGTALGDPVEIAALNDAYSSHMSAGYRCAIGSVKSNMGHLDTAAGVAGLMKAALSLKHREIPPSVNFRAPNRQCDFNRGPFFVAAQLMPWPDSPNGRYASVSSFGIGGTNAHVILREAPERPVSQAPDGPKILALSARHQKSLASATTALSSMLTDASPSTLHDISASLGDLPRYEHRVAIAARTPNEATQALRQALPSTLDEHHADTDVVWLFPGQGTQYVDMGRSLYDCESAFRDAFDECCALTRAVSRIDLRRLVYPDAGDDREVCAARLNDTHYTQIAVFAVEYSLARLWLSWGLKPKYMLGHSLGEYVAACVAGVFSLSDAIALVVARGRMIGDLEGGAMLSVAMDQTTLRESIGPAIEIAGVNAPQTCVVSGSHQDIQDLEKRLTAKGTAVSRVEASHAFHSAAMEPMLESYTELVRGVARSPPAMTVISNVTGQPLTAEQVSDPLYWRGHLRNTVMFQESMEWLASHAEGAVYLEVGPGRSLRSLARRNGIDVGRIVNSMPHRIDNADGHTLLHGAVARLWQLGADVNLARFHGPRQPRRVRVPGYAFCRERHWVEPDRSFFFTAASGGESLPSPPAGGRLYSQVWAPTPWPARRGTEPSTRRLIFGAEGAVELLDGNGEPHVWVRRGSSYSQESAGNFTVDPLSSDDLTSLFDALGDANFTVGDIDYCWALEPLDMNRPAADVQRGVLEAHMSLVTLLAAIKKHEVLSQREIALRVFTRCAYQISGSDAVDPRARAVAASALVIAQEEPLWRCRIVDLGPAGCSVLQYHMAAVLAAPALAKAPILGVRAKRLWSASFAVIETSETSAAALPIGCDDVIVFSGGLGKAGRALANLLADRCARLIVVGRRSPEQLDSGSRHVLEALKDRHGNVEYLVADLAQVESTEGLISSVLERFGSIALFIHGAGAMDVSQMRTMASGTDDHSAGQLDAKVRGTVNLYRSVRDRAVERVVLMSSLSATLGGPGLGAYAAANAFMDGFVEGLDATSGGDGASRQWYSIAWDGLITSERSALPESRRSSSVITPAEALRHLQHALSMPAGDLFLACTGNLGKRFTHATSASDARSQRASSVPARRGTRDIEPTTGTTESIVAAHFETLIGVTPIGATDGFFDLGGDSLLATQLNSRLQQDFGIDVPIAAVFEYPTVRELAERILMLRSEQGGQSLSELVNQIDSMDEAEVERRLTNWTDT